ncbi:MAG: SPOR domain-containing protein [Hydrogenophaga sp.]
MTPLFNHPRAQRGGTLLGLVFGVLLGLAAALAVAVYVTNVPVPFVDRGVTRKAAQDAAEAERNKGWNPNAGLVGTQEPLPAPTTDGRTGAGPTLLSPGSDTDNASPAAEPAGPSADPLGDLARSKLEGEKPANPPPAAPAAALSTAPPPAPPAASVQAQPFVYFVQVGAFRSEEDANAQRAKVALMGMASQVTEREQAGRPVFRVRLGPFNQLNLAEATRDQLNGKGVEAALVRVER